MEITTTEQERKQAGFPHELFLINLITNHILLFVGLLGLMKTYPILTLVTPSISFILLGYLILRARRELKNDSWFIMCHWQLCARRARFFIFMILLMIAAIIGLILSVGGDATALRPGHYAVGGIAILPTMFSILALIIMESDAMHLAKTSKLPAGIIKRFPEAK